MFRDPACEEEHEKKMKNMKMAGDPATVFFQKLEREAKLAGRRDDTERRGTMVAAVQQGVPWSYTSIITSIGVGIPQTYDEWKERILVMYEEQQRDRAYNETHGIGQTRPRQRQEAREFQTNQRPPATRRTPQGARQVPLAETRGATPKADGTQ